MLVAVTRAVRVTAAVTASARIGSSAFACRNAGATLLHPYLDRVGMA